MGIQNGIVYLKGSLAQPTPGSAIFANLPSRYRPTNNLYITVYTNGGTQGSLYIGHDGTMEAFSSGSCGSGNTAQCFTSLAAISFPVNSWLSGDGHHPIAGVVAASHVRREATAIRAGASPSVASGPPG